MLKYEDKSWPETAAVLCAGGTGRRMGGLRPKQFERLDEEGQSCISIALSALQALPLKTVVIAYPEGWHDELHDCLVDVPTTIRLVKVVGGNSRQASILNALEAIPRNTETVFIHDAARPFGSPELYFTLMRTLLADHSLAGVVPALSVVDTIKRRDDDGVAETVDRSDLAAVQTPQLFPYGMILELHRRAAQEEVTGTDDSWLVEHYAAQYKVALVEGAQWNFKITRPADRIIAQALLKGEQVAHWTRI